MSKDADYRKMINSARWMKLRRDVLNANPLCERCKKEGYITPANEVHHHRPVEYGLNFAEKERLMFDPLNLRALCHDCHVKEHIEMGRSGKVATKRRNKEQVKELINKYF